MPHRLTLILIILPFVGMTPPTFAQGEPLQGTVVNSSGSPINGAEIRLVATNIEAPILEQTTGEDGVFTIPADHVRPGLELHLSHGAYEDKVVPITAQQLVVTTMTVKMIRARKTPTPVSTPSAAPTPVGPTVSDKQRRQAVEVYNEAIKAYEEAEDDDTATKNAAIRKLRLAASMDPTFAEPVRILLSQAMKRQNWAEAGRYAEDLIRIDPSDLEAIRTQYSCMIITQHYIRIGESARRLVKVDPGAIVHIDEHARQFHTNENYRMARALYEVLIDIVPDPTNAYLNLGLCCANLGDEECTRDAFEVFLELAPDDNPHVETVRQHLEATQEVGTE